MDFSELMVEHSTKAGLNEQVLADFRSGGGAHALSSALNRVFDRIAPMRG
jgi:hypothetical protein